MTSTFGCAGVLLGISIDTLLLLCWSNSLGTTLPLVSSCYCTYDSIDVMFRWEQLHHTVSLTETIQKETFYICVYNKKLYKYFCQHSLSIAPSSAPIWKHRSPTPVLCLRSPDLISNFVAVIFSANCPQQWHNQCDTKRVTAPHRIFSQFFIELNSTFIVSAYAFFGSVFPQHWRKDPLLLSYAPRNGGKINLCFATHLTAFDLASQAGFIDSSFVTWCVLHLDLISVFCAIHGDACIKITRFLRSEPRLQPSEGLQVHTHPNSLTRIKPEAWLNTPYNDLLGGDCEAFFVLPRKVQQKKIEEWTQCRKPITDLKVLNHDETPASIISTSN